MEARRLNLELTEYQVTYATKEWLTSMKWDVIAFNPPGSQGTFTIPNPEKDPNFRGQTGSESPDIIAVKGRYVLTIEAKPKSDAKDIEKLRKLRDDDERLDLYSTLVRRVCEANEVFLGLPLKFIWATATPDDAPLENWLGHFKVSLVQTMDVSNLVASKDYSTHFAVELSSPTTWDSDYLFFEN